MTPAFCHLRTDYAAVNARGVKLYTFSDREAGKAWVRENAYRHDGLHLRRITITEEPIYRPRAPRPAAFDIPAMPVRA
ncbi:hypothetical protein [Brevundimonas balnearis]|uniref:Uncharacterized protein n=1 Tax=Brevundimonas balnearis TaxID=1572858 RepID=A0ABV6R0V9_9CAUL